MTHQPTQLLSRVGSGSVRICVIGLQVQLDFFLHSSLIPDCLVGSGPPYDSTVELGWLMCHGLYTEDAGLPYFDRAAVIANGTWLCCSALKSMGAKLCFRSCLVNIGPSYT